MQYSKSRIGGQIMKYQYNGKNYDKIIVWGGGRSILNYEYMMEYVDYIVDSNPQFEGKQRFGLNVYSPKIIANEQGNILVAVATFRYFNEIKEAAFSINNAVDVVFIEDVFKNKAVFFGEYREDAIVEKLIRNHTTEKISYLEIGVPDPVHGSNTYHFYINGSTGVCVEANPDMIEGVKSRRPKDKVICCGCGALKDEGTSLNYYVIRGRIGRNTFSEETLRALMEQGFECERTIKIPMISLNRIIENYYSKTPEYISIDVEGYEYTILRDFNFEKYPISIFCIEKGDEKVKILMKQEGYKLVAETPANWIFMKEEWAKKNGLLLEH